MKKLIKKFGEGNTLGTKFKRGTRTQTNLCAEFSNNQLRENGYLIHGNAWNLKDADIVYSGYEGLTKPEEYDNALVQKYNGQASDNVLYNFDSSTLDKSKDYAVNMYYKNSPALEQAFNEGRDNMTGTHTGYLSWNPNTNRWEIIHNIHGTIHIDPFKVTLGKNRKYGVTAIFLPRDSTMFNKMKSFLHL